MSVKKIYYYWFYQYYTFLNKSIITRGNTKFKAVFAVLFLETWTIFSLKNYYEIFSGKRDNDLTFFSLKVQLPLLLLILVNWYLFTRDDRWKDYVKEFDQWPKTKNKKGGWIVLGVTLFIIANFCISMKLNPPPGGYPS